MPTALNRRTRRRNRASFASAVSVRQRRSNSGKVTLLLGALTPTPLLLCLTFGGNARGCDTHQHREPEAKVIKVDRKAKCLWQGRHRRWVKGRSGFALHASCGIKLQQGLPCRPTWLYARLEAAGCQARDGTDCHHDEHHQNLSETCRVTYYYQTA